MPGPRTPFKVSYSSPSSPQDKANDSTYLLTPPNSIHSEHHIKVPAANEPAKAFIQRLLSHNLRNETVFDILDEEDIEDEVCILRDKDTLYTLIPDSGGLDHDDLASEEDRAAWTCFCRLDYEEEHSNAKSSVASKGATCHYIRLGWLVRQDVRTKSRITTNYVLLLNVSSEIPSLWLAYDYVSFDDKGNDRLRKLGDNYNDHEYDAWYHGRRSFLDNDPRSLEEDTSPSKFRSLDTDFGGYFGVGKPFDLAMVSPDVKEDWKGRVSSGLDGAKVRACMADNSHVLGETLRAVPSRPNGYSEC